MKVPSTRAAQSGFTLVEAVMVIVITGILGGIVAVFIKVPMQAYTDTAGRAEMSDIADTALRRISRDVRLALPNSIRVANGGRTLGFLLTKTGGRYQAAEDGLASGNILDFVTPALTFDVMGAMPQGAQQIVAGDFIVVYNLGPGFPSADAYAGGNAAVVSAVNTASRSITLGANPFALANPPMSSPTNRFQVVSGTVNYYCDGLAQGGSGTLWRYVSAGQIVAALATPPAGVASALATNVLDCNFTYASLANIHSGLTGISITLQRPAPATDAALTLVHQIHVDNTP